uniref:Uncharacterized protein n=1 Tax=Acrobeloides nanus TaxID=290746 RepID=A0A914DC16_9BILA
MLIKCLPNLRNEQVATTGLTYDWILNTLKQYDTTFEQSLNEGEVTLIKKNFLGNPAVDMARIMTLCTDAEIRRELETFIFDFYYENLTKIMETTGKKIDFDVGKNDFILIGWWMALKWD